MHKITLDKKNVKYIPLEVLNDVGLTFSEKSLLAMLYATQINDTVCMKSILIRWVEGKKFVTDHCKIPKQLGLTIDSLFDKRHVVKVFEGNKLVSLKLRPIYGDKHIIVRDTLTKNLKLKVNEFLVALVYASTADNFYVCHGYAAKKIGISKTTFKKYSTLLTDRGILNNNRLTKEYNTSRKLTTFKRRVVDNSVKSRRSFWSHRNIYIDIYNSISKKEFFILKNRKLFEYLDLINEDKILIAEQIRTLMHQKGFKKSQQEVISYLDELKFKIPETSWSKKFINDYKFACYVVNMMKGITLKRFSLAELLTDELLSQAQLLVAGEDGDYYELKYIKWRLQRLDTSKLVFYTKDAFVKFVVRMLEKDFRPARETEGWDMSFDPSKDYGDKKVRRCVNDPLNDLTYELQNEVYY